MVRRTIARGVPGLLLFLAAGAFAQTLEPTPTPAPPTPAPAEASQTPGPAEAAATPIPETPAAAEKAPTATDSRAMIDRLGECVESGRLALEIDFLEGNYPAAPAWTVETHGPPHAAITADAAAGRVQKLDASIGNGQLLVRGRGLRPKVYVESFSFEDGKGVTQAKFRGKGIWRPIVSIFRGVAMSALKKLQLNTDIPSILRGEVLGARKATPKGGAPPDATPTPAPEQAAAAPTPPGPSFLDLVDEVQIHDSSIVAFPRKPLGLGEMVHFQTASQVKGQFPLRVTVDAGRFRPGHGGAASSIELEGRVDGEIENGAFAFAANRVTFSRGELRGGTYRVHSDDSGKLQTELGASSFGLDLTSGEFHVPGGPEVSVSPPSRLGFRDLHMSPDGTYSAVLDADLYGKTGRLARSGSVISASDIQVRTLGTRVKKGRADGDVDLQFTYRVEYPLVIDYPVEELGVRRVPLLFVGPFRTHLHFENAGTDEGTVTGDYSFKVPWPPVEQAAVELLRARWRQDIKAVIRKVDFTIEPRRFGPCGGTCFLVELGITAEKKKDSGKSLFKQICEPEGRADLVVDPASRSFILKNIKVQPKCKGVVGWVINFIAPLVTKTYTDMTVFQMPAGLPFTVESVGSGANYVSIAGRVDWEAGKEKGTAAPAAPSSGP
jgi:hypothetical protein